MAKDTFLKFLPVVPLQHFIKVYFFKSYHSFQIGKQKNMFPDWKLGENMSGSWVKINNQVYCDNVLWHDGWLSDKLENYEYLWLCDKLKPSLESLPFNYVCSVVFFKHLCRLNPDVDLYSFVQSGHVHVLLYSSWVRLHSPDELD